MTQAFTPGPWTADQSYPPVIYAAADSRLPDYSNHGASIPLFKSCRATLMGDIRLAAAAPDLLYALQEVMAELDAREWPQGHIYRDTGGMILARMAIEKATDAKGNGHE